MPYIFGFGRSCALAAPIPINSRTYKTPKTKFFEILLGKLEIIEFIFFWNLSGLDLQKSMIKNVLEDFHNTQQESKGYLQHY